MKTRTISATGPNGTIAGLQVSDNPSATYCWGYLVIETQEDRYHQPIFFKRRKDAEMLRNGSRHHTQIMKRKIMIGKVQ